MDALENLNKLQAKFDQLSSAVKNNSMLMEEIGNDDNDDQYVEFLGEFSAGKAAGSA